ncbi:hypothetical protein Daus18300_005215 [Diaporthe australafricana]|uniref:Transmembrane protein n=1 Tax=Diaporthe australafricana TaxID=127596 RepID=A0ABR3X2H2_9PEZI
MAPVSTFMLQARKKIKKVTKYKSGRKLSKPAAIAIAVAVAVVLIIAIISVIIVQRRRKAKKHNSTPTSYSNDNSDGLYGPPAGGYGPPPHGIYQGQHGSTGPSQPSYRGGEADQYYYGDSASVQGE